MQNRWFVISMTIAILMCAATMLQADTPAGVSPKNTIVFNAPTVVGGTLLPAGEYAVLHEMNGAEHVMVFKEKGGQKAEAKAKCNLVPLADGKAKQTEQKYTENAKNERVLVEMTFRGDTQKHVLAQ
jgi:hypothetical protein